ncbi:hypothetical protein QL093DRAFT_1463273 [Fusarium oxysporum]|nr:hypothetical protein QL093DRAFT_1444852 [Fusarium oxysporum]KAJ9419928.1 hypothetical protein QL093DRAFT_1463273 [Fusarium oxysporum]
MRHVSASGSKDSSSLCQKHQWINPRCKGRSSTESPTPPAELPWIAGISCQRFFSSRSGNKWFQVDQNSNRQKIYQSGSMDRIHVMSDRCDRYTVVPASSGRRQQRDRPGKTFEIPKLWLSGDTVHFADTIRIGNGWSNVRGQSCCFARAVHCHSLPCHAFPDPPGPGII